jgi:MFS family permease
VVPQSISVFGSELTFFALSVWLMQTLYPRPEQRPELAVALSAVSLSFAIPRLLLITFAGAWADRHDRKRTMMAMDFASGLLSAVLAVLVITNTLNLPLLLVLLVLWVSSTTRPLTPLTPCWCPKANWAAPTA